MLLNIFNCYKILLRHNKMSIKDNIDELQNLMRLHEITDDFKGLIILLINLEMLNVLSQLSKLDFELNDNDLELLTRCFKNYIGIKRNQYRKIDAMIERDNMNST